MWLRGALSPVPWQGLDFDPALSQLLSPTLSWPGASLGAVAPGPAQAALRTRALFSPCCLDGKVQEIQSRMWNWTIWRLPFPLPNLRSSALKCEPTYGVVKLKVWLCLGAPVRTAVPVTLTAFLLCARLGAEPLSCLISLGPHKNPVRLILLWFIFY